MATISEALTLAVQHHQAGRLQEAEQIYRQILAVDASHVDALHLLGVVALQLGQPALAVEYIGRAIALKGSEPAFYNNMGEAYRALQNMSEAAACYRRAVKLKPDYTEAHHSLGLALNALGKLDDAVACYRRALQLWPDNAEVHNHLGNALIAQRKLDDAVTSYRRALEARPGYAEAHYNLGNVFMEQRNLDDAVTSYRRALDLKPDTVEALNNLGLVYMIQGKPEDAIACYSRALEFKPDCAEVHNNLGEAYRILGRMPDAAVRYRRTLELKPNFAKAYNGLGLALSAQGKVSEAVACFCRALELWPDSPEFHNNLGNAYKSQGRWNMAAACYRRALELEPACADAHNNLGNILKDQGNLVEAAACYHRALELRPDFAEVHNNLGNALKDQGLVDDALACYRRTVELKPEYVQAHSNFIFTLNYGSALDSQAIFEEHGHWNQQHAVPLAKLIQPHSNDRSAERRLRIGYVSPNFCLHSVAYFIEPILANHDPQQVEVFCYAEVAAADAVTARLRSMAHHWRFTCGLSDEQFSALIRADGIDVLIDLAGHTADNRLLVFARKPAPVQVTYLGYTNTTGLDSIDYRLTDAIADPPGVADHYYTEELIRLPATFLCYRPPADSPLPSKTPTLARGCITFGSFNTLAKLSPAVVTLWGRLLAAAPGSRLLLKAQGLADEEVRRLVRERFAAQGMRPDQLELRGWEPSLAEHLESYHDVDIALDTFPCNGTTTICEALWMGVPVVTLSGNCHAGRVGAGILNCMGLADLVAATAEEYIAIACRLAEDRAELAHLRSGMRERMTAAPLCGEKAFTRRLEVAYRDLWQRWCTK